MMKKMLYKIGNAVLDGGDLMAVWGEVSTCWSPFHGQIDRRFVGIVSP
jgi:hypothetical protein